MSQLFICHISHSPFFCTWHAGLYLNYRRFSKK
nr:MAG TPA: hypothetical protein [Caudoviricetes sp.]